jgi:phosphocarrier protein HPr
VEVTTAVEGGHPVSASSVLGVMALGAEYGHTVTLAAEGEETESVLDDLACLPVSDGEP